MLHRLIGMLLLLCLALLPGTAGAAMQVQVLQVDGAITPASADFVVRGLDKAAAEGAGLVVLQIDTPGGLDKAMRDIIKAILASPVPVATYVAPSGARAASAGTYILYASHIAAMAPATNLGAATPVQIGIGGPGGEEPKPKPATDKKDGEQEKDAPAQGQSPMKAKMENDAAAYIRGLAQLRGRNADWAERAVREAVSLSAEEALKQKVIDLVATDVPDLLKQLHGRKVDVAGTERTLDTQGAMSTALEPDWRNRLLSVITDPSLALILMMIGIYGLIFEFSNPGAVVPGVVGGIALLLGLYAMQLLPVNYAGLALIVLGIGLMVAEAFAPSFGLLGMGGVAAFVFGSIILIDTDVPGLGIPMSLIVALGLTSALIVLVIVRLAIRSRRRPLVSGPEYLIGAPGEALEDISGEGWARVHSETWRVRSAVPLQRGQALRVVGIDGLTLGVEPASKPFSGE